MSLEVKDRFSQKGIYVKSGSLSDGDYITIGNNTFTMKDFLLIIYYVLTNTDLRENDPRLEFSEQLKLLKIIDGYNKETNPNSKRLEIIKEKDLNKNKKEA